MTRLKPMLLSGLVCLVAIVSFTSLDAVFGGTEPIVPATVGAPMLTITKTCPTLRYLNRNADYEITVTNRGTGAADNVVVTDNVPAGVEFVSADNGGQRSGGNVVWRVGRMEAGESRILHMTVRCNQITMVRNRATVSYCVESAATCEFPVKGIPAILLECVDDPDPIEVGAQLTYTIIVTNQGSENGTNISIECQLPVEQEFVKAAGPTDGRADNDRAVRFAPLAMLPPKAKAVYAVTVKGIRAADSRFGVKLMSDQTDSPVNETESTHIYE